MRTEGHPACLRIAVIFFLLTFVLCLGALSAQDLNLEQDGSVVNTRGSLMSGDAASSAMADIESQGVQARAGDNPVRPVSKTFSLTTAGYLALSASDFYLSNRCIQQGQCVEVGSYRGVASHPLAFAVVKMGASSALAATAWSLRKQHPRAAWGTLIGLTVAQSAVVIWNSQQGVRK